MVFRSKQVFPLLEGFLIAIWLFIHSVTFTGCVHVLSLFCRLTSSIFNDSTRTNRIQFKTASRDVFVTLACLLDSHLIEMFLCSVKSVDTLCYLHTVDSPALQCNLIQVLHCPAVQKWWWFCLSATINSFNLCEDDAHQQFTFFYSLIVSSFTVHYFHSVVSPVYAAVDQCCSESITALSIIDLK